MKKSKGYLRNIDINISIVALMLLLLLVPASPMRDGFLAQWFSFLLGMATCCGFGSYTHRQLFRNMRPHLHTHCFRHLCIASAFRALWIMLFMMGYLLWVL